MTAPLTPHAFVAKWRRADLAERSAVQQHFLDLCALVGHPPLLVVSDIDTIEIHTNFTDTAKRVITLALDDLLTAEGLRTLRLNLERAGRT